MSSMTSLHTVHPEHITQLEVHIALLGCLCCYLQIKGAHVLPDGFCKLTTLAATRVGWWRGWWVVFSHQSPPDFSQSPKIAFSDRLFHG